MKKKVIKYLLTGIGVAILRKRDPVITDAINDVYARYDLDVENNEQHAKIANDYTALAYGIAALLWPLVIVDSIVDFVASDVLKLYDRTEKL